MNGVLKKYEKSALYGAEVDFTWDGELAHCGPVEPGAGNKLANITCSYNICARASLGAGLLELGVLRFCKATIPSKLLLQRVEASFAWQVDRRYYRRNQQLATSMGTPEQQALRSIEKSLVYPLFETTLRAAYFGYSNFHAIHIMRHITRGAGRRVFLGWLNPTLNRLVEIAPEPKVTSDDFRGWIREVDPDGGPDVNRVPPPGNEFYKPDPNFKSRSLKNYCLERYGEALPPQVLDPDFDYDPAKREELVDTFLRKLDWRENPYLATPEEMKAVEFPGTPYRLD